MIALEQQHTYRMTLTRCPRCAAHAGSDAWSGGAWLSLLTIDDGVQSVAAVLCRRPQCGFAELRGLTAAPAAAPAASRLRAFAGRHPLAFACVAVLHGSAIGLLLTLR
ncbi:MAG TPA: hypothetical protein VEK11_00935 [Thermoanaerobaculia bacterium]|nr:hypothetical protein [Thermoanaerobaculia bacterium]